MSIETDLRTYLLSRNGVTTYVATKIFTDKRPQKRANATTSTTELHTLPAITIHSISGGEEHHLTGAPPHGIPRVQVSVWAGTRVEALNVREALRNALQGYPQAQSASGVWGSTTIVGSVVFESGPALYENDEGGGDQGTYHQPIDLTIWFQQPSPTT